MALNKKKYSSKKKEKPNRKKKDRSEAIKGLSVNYFIIVIVGLAILIGSILTYILILKNIYGNFEISEILPTTDNLIEFKYSEKIGLLYSGYTANMLNSNGDSEGDWVQNNIDTWKEFLKKMKIEYEQFSDLNLEEGKHYKYNLLILAGAKALSDKEVMQIKRYIDAGGSVLATGGVAAFSDEAKWRGWEFFKEAFGMKFTKELSPDEVEQKTHTLRGNLQLTAGIPTGYVLKIKTWDRPVYAEVLEPRTTQVSYWYDYRGERGLVDEEIRKSAGISNGTYGKGRFVWYGFELNSVVGTKEDYTYLARLVQNSVDWLTYNPTSFIKDWPEPFKAAAIYVPTIKENTNNIDGVKGTIKLFNNSVSILVDAGIALNNPREMADLSKVGSLVPIIDLGEVQDLINYDEGEKAQEKENYVLRKQVQQAEISYARDSLSRMINKPIDGIMPYYGFYDKTTLDILAEENIKYIITDSLVDRSVPRKVVMDGKDIFILTNTSRDDIVVLDEFGLKEKEFQKYTYLEDIDRMVFEGGLYILKLHNNYQLQPQYRTIFKDVVKHMHSEKVWVTSIPELLRWWNAKKGVELRYEVRGKRRIVVEVSNHKATRGDQFTVEVNLNKDVKNIKITTDLINIPIPKFKFDKRTKVLSLYIKDLGKDESRTYLIDYENVNKYNANERMIIKR